jgi:hypothetical protein
VFSSIQSPAQPATPLTARLGRLVGSKLGWLWFCIPDQCLIDRIIINTWASSSPRSCLGLRRYAVVAVNGGELHRTLPYTAVHRVAARLLSFNIIIISLICGLYKTGMLKGT